MSTFIIHLDETTYPGGASEAQSTIEAAGITIQKTFQLSPLTYQVQGDEATVSALPGLIFMEDRENSYNVSLQNLNTDHLDFTVSVDGQESFMPQYTGAGVEVYLVDTGVKETHAEFENANINNFYSNFAGDFADSVGHGTAMASLIVGKNIGAARDAQLHVVKLFDNASNTITVGEILDAFDEILLHHQNSSNPNKPKVVCTPWIIEHSGLVNLSAHNLLLNGLILVCAAGNTGTDIDLHSPASVRTAITVGAFNRNFEVTAFTNTPWTGTEPTDPSFVNYGSALDIFALGVDVTTASIGANDDYLQGSGTSVSSAIVAGILTHYIQQYPEKSSNLIRETFLSEGHYVGSTTLVFDNQNANVDYSQVYPAIVTTENSGQATLTSKASGRLINVRKGAITQTDVGLNPNATDVEVLDFAPTPSWISFDLSTGTVDIDAQNLSSETVPGVYLFAIRGSVGGDMLVEEFSVGVYNDKESELVEDGVASYYYDSQNDAYDEVVSYSLAKEFN